MAPATYTVTNTADSVAGSLRAAIDNANVDGIEDTNEFNIGGGGEHTIAPASGNTLPS